MFSYYLQCPCGFMCCPFCSSLFLCFLLFLCCVHCNCFICVTLFQKQSWECDFNNSWFKTPFEQYAFKLLFIIIWKPFFYRKAFLLLDRVLSWIPLFPCVLMCFPVFSYYLQCPCGFMCCPLCSSLSFVAIWFPLSLFHLGSIVSEAVLGMWFQQQLVQDTLWTICI